MATDIVMPALSPGMEKGHLARWLKSEGEAVKTGDVIAEIETDKATLELEAAHDGVLSRILVAAGSSDVPVNERIAILGLADDGSGVEPSPPVESAPAALAADEAIRREETAAKIRLPPTRAASASPRARWLAKEFGIDPSAVLGSGPQGRILERNIRDFVTAATMRAPGPDIAASAGAVSPVEATDPVAVPATPDGERVPHDTMRLTIARRLTQAKRDIPHFYLAKDWQVDGLLGLRERINAAAPRDAQGEPSYAVTINDMLIKAWALALHETPGANVSWAEDGMISHRQADIAVAVSMPGGLVTPVVRAAESKSISTITREMQDLASRARSLRLTPEEYQGGSSAISNLGMFGIGSFAAIINPPQASILAVGAVEKRMLVRDDAPAIARMMSFTLSLDHRAIDGALGAALMARFGTLIEEPLRLLA